MTEKYRKKRKCLGQFSVEWMSREVTGGNPLRTIHIFWFFSEEG